MVERGLRLLVKTNRAATAGRLALGGTPVDLKLTPLMPSIDRPAGPMMAAAPAWHRRVGDADQSVGLPRSCAGLAWPAARW
jgi:hypothetical protein